MGVRTLIGEADGTTHAAAMYDSVTGRMVGPIFEADDAEDQVEAFLEWMRTLRFVELVDRIGLTHTMIPDPRADPTDPRAWPFEGLDRLAAHWRREHVEDGLLKATAS